jgi:stage V sporulation protein AE
MEIFLTYLKVFAVGGAICLLGQILINKTRMTAARILVIFLLIGAVLELVGAFTYMEEFAKAGVTVPIMGFGATLTRGAVSGAAEKGILGAVSGGMSAVAGALSCSILFGFLFALIFKSKSKMI